MRHRLPERQRQVGRLDRHPADRLHLPDDAERHRGFDGVELGGEVGIMRRTASRVSVRRAVVGVGQQVGDDAVELAVEVGVDLPAAR